VVYLQMLMVGFVRTCAAIAAACSNLSLLMRALSGRWNPPNCEWAGTYSLLEPIRSYAKLQEQLHHDLRAQHPEWIDSDGNGPMCDWYDRRLAELIWTVHVGTRV
jgi:hypothetical protein